MQTRQRDVFRDSPASLADAARKAAAASRLQFPDDKKRAEHYEQLAAKYEQQAKEQGQWAA